MLKLITKFATVLVTTLSFLHAQNLLSNGSFEDGVGGGWNLYVDGGNGGAGTLESVTSEEAQHGSKFARVNTTAVVDSKNWYVQFQDPSWAAEAGVEYHISFYAKADDVRTIQVAAAGGPASNYTYYTGSEFVLGKEWKKIDFFYKSAATGTDSLNFNIYCGYAVGTYDFDNVVIESVSMKFPSTITPPSKSAWESGTHRNLFTELGYSQEQVDEKVNSTFQQLFFGDRTNEVVYTEEGDDLGYITKPGSGSIITEGQSYGMMIAVQMNRQDIFDRLWKFAYTKMMHQEGPRKGIFSWKLEENAPHAMVDPNPAPDGEEYFVTSLLFAAKRWGNKEGIFNYQEQADNILNTMLNFVPNETVVAEIDKEHAMILFTPDAQSTRYTDPSYHLPAFYTIWSELATNDKDFWKKMADTSRAFFKRACHETTGLTADYAAFDGTPYPVDFNRFAGWYHSDSWRVPMNIGMDYAWFKADPWQLEYSQRLMTWFASQTPDYKQTYSIDGTAQSEEEGSMVTYNASQGQVACNAVAALASTDTIAWKYVDRFWKQATPTGEWRYYSGLLHMLSLLHVSGNFKIWGNPALPVKEFRSVTSFQSKELRGTARILDISGKTIGTVDLGKGTAVSSINGSILNKFNVRNRSNGVYFIKAIDEKGNNVVKQITTVK